MCLDTACNLYYANRRLFDRSFFDRQEAVRQQITEMFGNRPFGHAGQVFFTAIGAQDDNGVVIAPESDVRER